MVFLDSGNIVRSAIVIAFLFIITVSGCTKTELVPEEEYAGYHDFNSYADFINTLDELAGIEDIIQGHSWGNKLEMLKPTLTFFFALGT